MRSALFVPGNRAEWIDKAPGYGADALVLDLEDATPPGEKARARSVVAERLPRLAAQGQPAWVRVNEPGSDQLAADVPAICRPGLHAVCLPKVAGAGDVRALDRLLTYAEGASGLPLGTVGIVPLLEVATGVARPLEVFEASDRVAYAGGMAAAGADVERALGYRWSEQFTETFVLRSLGLIAARAAGVDNPMTGLASSLDTDQVRRFAEEGRALGYAGMFVIHPTHVPIANEAFSPSDVEVAAAHDVIARYEQGEVGGRGAVLDAGGAMIDAAHVKTARLLIERHRLLERRGRDT